MFQLHPCPWNEGRKDPKRVHHQVVIWWRVIGNREREEKVSKERKGILRLQTVICKILKSRSRSVHGRQVRSWLFLRSKARLEEFSEKVIILMSVSLFLMGKLK